MQMDNDEMHFDKDVNKQFKMNNLKSMKENQIDISYGKYFEGKLSIYSISCLLHTLIIPKGSPITNIVIRIK